MKSTDDVKPLENTNINNHVKISKGDMGKGWANSDITVEGTFVMPQSDHAAMETRVSQCSIPPDGHVKITTSSQAPFSVKDLLASYTDQSPGNINVRVPFVGGGFGGKVTTQLDVLAFLASKAVGGKEVRLANTREEDLFTSPCHLGLEAHLRIGAKKDGTITAAEMSYYVDSGAYTDIGPRLAKAIAVDCAGPYHIENLHCDSYSVYTNHTFATSFRGFGHTAVSFCMERMLDKLANALGLDPFSVRMANALKEGDFSPTQVKVTLSNAGNIGACLKKLHSLIRWDEGVRIEQSNHLVRAKGIGCFMKTSDSPTDAISGVLLHFNKDGSININFGAVEIGPGMKTTACQILAQKMRMDVNRIFVKMEVDTETTPRHWKTVASMTTFMAGKAILQAADDLISQLLSLAGTAMRCSPDDLDYGDERSI